MRPKGALKDVQKKFVRLRIVNMKDVDIGLFEFDFDNTFQIFVLNHKEQIYMRYGGRDDQSADSYLSTKGLVKALKKSLEMHKSWQQGQLKLPERAKRKMSQSYPNVKQVVRKNKCVHCHQVAEGRAVEVSKSAGFDKKRDVFIYPDPQRLGMIFDQHNNLRLKKVRDTAKSGGLKRGDVLVKLNGQWVVTFTDLQYGLHKLKPGAKAVILTIERKGKSQEVSLKLPEYWRVTNINRRAVGHKLEPFPGFWAKGLSVKEKRKLGLKKDGFASRVTKFWVNTNGKKAGMRQGDIIYAVNGVKASPYAINVMIYIRLFHKTGESLTVQAVRGGKRLQFQYRLKAKPW